MGTYIVILIGISHGLNLAGVDETISLREGLIRKAGHKYINIGLVHVGNIILLTKTNLIYGVRIVKGVIVSADICTNGGIGSAVLQEAQEGVPSLAHTKGVEVHSGIMHQLGPVKTHIPAIYIRVISVLSLLAVVEINNGAATLRNKHKAIFRCPCCSEVRKRGDHIRRQTCGILDLAERDLHYQILAVQAVVHVDIIYLLILGFRLVRVVFLVSLVILVGVAILCEDGLHLLLLNLLNRIAGVITQGVDHFPVCVQGKSLL